MEVYDKNLRPIKVGDILKVFHFIGARRKHHYMYKQVTQRINSIEYARFRLSHLNLCDDIGYNLAINDRVNDLYEIVQSLDCDFESREKKPEDTKQ